MVKSDLLSLSNISKNYGPDRVLNRVNLSIQAGECVVLAGHNGAGKTTLLKLILGLIKPTEGSVSVLGQDPVNKKSVKAKRSLGYLPERVSFYESMTGLETLKFYSKLKSEPVSQCAALLETVGLDSSAYSRSVSTYSKGMKQRLGLAQALLGDPDLLLLDEPTSGLDPTLRRQFYDIIQQKCQAGKAVIVSSHSLVEIEAQADRVIILNKGSVVASGSVQELYQQSDLPLSIQLSIKSGHEQQVEDSISTLAISVQKQNSILTLECKPADKMEFIKQIADLGDIVKDIQIKPPRLDDVYLHYALSGLSTPSEQPSSDATSSDKTIAETHS
ncbi:MAG: ABC transporter ATP-binding protein [Pseudomonadales bacterium]|nr:ABC transporter ATP-binding protein [Pseudomonadales bacterium]